MRRQLKITLEALDVINAIATHGSFAAAADALHKVPSAVTYTVRKLESDLDISIFDRSGHKAILTKAGQELVKEGSLLLEGSHSLESRLKQISSGVETEICIAVEDLVSMQAVYRILADFYQQNFNTRIKIISEVYGGAWDAILFNRADLAIGTIGAQPSGAQCITQALGQMDFVFSVAADHPLANVNRKLTYKDIKQYRSVAAADSSRHLSPRTSGILTGQDILTIPSIQTKIDAQIAGLGIGYLPEHLVRPYIESGQLVEKETVEAPKKEAVSIAWTIEKDKAMGVSLSWLLNALKSETLESLYFQK